MFEFLPLFLLDQNLIELIILNLFLQSFIAYQSEEYMSLIEIRDVGNWKYNLLLELFGLQDNWIQIIDTNEGAVGIFWY